VLSLLLFVAAPDFALFKSPYVKKQYREGDLNPHTLYGAKDFKS
jgi:hypothetical protein